MCCCFMLGMLYLLAVLPWGFIAVEAVDALSRRKRWALVDTAVFSGKRVFFIFLMYKKGRRCCAVLIAVC